MITDRTQLAFLFLCAVTPGQELLWEAFPTTGTTYTGYITGSFGDLDHDGCDDLLALSLVRSGVPANYAVRILSGRDGSVLYQQFVYYQLVELVGVGDFDGDGYPDFAWTLDGYSGLNAVVEVWSPHTGAPLLQIPEPSGNFGNSWGYLIAGHMDFDGDGLRDLLVGSVHPNQGELQAYNHFGTRLYTLSATALGLRLRDVAPVGDIDGDGRDDYVVGASELTFPIYGVVALVSGATGQVLRVHRGLQPFDVLGDPVCAAGDVDHDGVMDYAAGNYAGQRGVVEVFSGATGALLRTWIMPAGQIGGRLLAGRDIDLDGVPDIVSPLTAYSMRDGERLVSVVPQQPVNYFGASIADLGVQPGNPYPVVALVDQPTPPADPFRIQAWRYSPKGTHVVGSGCSSVGITPSIGLRRVDGFSGDTSRIVLGSARAGAMAVCCVASAASQSWLGSPLPVALGGIGFTGCSLLVPPDLAAFRIAGFAGIDQGYAGVDLHVPLVGLGGSTYAAQWLIFDPATLDYGATQRHDFRIQ